MQQKNPVKIKAAEDLFAEGKTVDDVNIELMKKFKKGMNRNVLCDIRRKVLSDFAVKNLKEVVSTLKNIDNVSDTKSENIVKIIEPSKEHIELLKQFYDAFFKIGFVVSKGKLDMNEFKNILKIFDDKLLNKIKDELKIGKDGK